LSQQMYTRIMCKCIILHAVLCGCETWVTDVKGGAYEEESVNRSQIVL
jgi:hypothetical protein